MTAAASGSNGIRQVDNDNLDFDISDFSIGCILSIPDWTPASSTYIYVKRQGGSDYIQFRLNSNGTLLLVILIGGVTIINATSTTSVPVTSGAAFITASVVRETASSDGSVTFYANGVQVGAALVISAAATASISNTGSSEWGGWNGSRSAISFLSGSLFNRALTAAEVLDLSINGVAPTDREASQAPISGDCINGTGSREYATFTGSANGFIGTATANSITRNAGFLIKVKAGQVVRFSADITATGTYSTTLSSVRLLSSIVSNTAESTEVLYSAISGGSISGSIIANSNGEFFLSFSTRVNTGGTDSVVTVTNLVVRTLGVTSELIASNAQSNTGQIFDTSGNKNHALLPASGATVVGRPVSQTREVRWTNTWDGTNELQYIGGVNQAILPANAYIESIVGTVSGATPHDIIIGDGSDADRYVTITTGLAAGTTSFTLANRTTDGTNLKLTVDPDTNATMSIAWVISYKTLES
jgi:hypothetical protein